MNTYITEGNSILTKQYVWYMVSLIKYEIPVLTTKNNKLKSLYGY